MFGKKKKEFLTQAARIRELEEILCPCEQHDWVSTGYHFDDGTGYGDSTTFYHYICKRCKKRMQMETLSRVMISDGR